VVDWATVPLAQLESDEDGFMTVQSSLVKDPTDFVDSLVFEKDKKEQSPQKEEKKPLSEAEIKRLGELIVEYSRLGMDRQTIKVIYEACMRTLAHHFHLFGISHLFQIRKDINLATINTHKVSALLHQTKQSTLLLKKIHKMLKAL
jgi:hypothetical protein